MNGLTITGFPEGICETEAAVCRSRLLRAVRELQEQTGVGDIELRIGAGEPEPATPAPNPDEPAESGEWSVEGRARQYGASDPLWTLEHLVVPETVRDELLNAIELISLEPLVFDTWGLRAIEPFPRSALNFHGPPGTGKTLAAHAVAAQMGRQIIVASYAQIESKFHGDGPKNVESLFHAARRDDAVLFIDEADSLLSRRLTNVTQGSEQAINSMRSQLLICLEKHAGIVVFATNLVENYDPAFETRVRHIRFPLPDFKARAQIWSRHLPHKLPLSLDVDLAELAVRSDGLCGREIKTAVIDAALRAARAGRNGLALADLLGAVDRLLRSRSEVGRAAAGDVAADRVARESLLPVFPLRQVP